MKRKIEVPELARVEGEGGLYIALSNGDVAEIRLDIYEPPRFFEGFLRDRYLQEVPDITARICGICPVAYQMSSVYALEKAIGHVISPSIRKLRRLLYCAEYIESHALHIYMLQAPDLLGHPSALSLAAVAPEIVQNALRLKKIGNQLLRIIGGRSVHPVSACVGGFYRWPQESELKALLPELRWGLEASKETVRWSLDLPYPELEVDYEFVALHLEDEYAIIEGDVLSSQRGLIPIAEFPALFPELHVKHSNALHSLNEQGQPYLVGPLARLNLNYQKLGPAAQAILAETGLQMPLLNPYKSLIARAVELVDAYDLAIELIEHWAPEGPSREELKLKAGYGCAGTEAPRGMLYHSYRINEGGFVQAAHIMPPTAQNLARIEADLARLVPQIVDLPQDEATLHCEHLVRAYDPCISCATHFLKLKIEHLEG
ncbi:MAG: Ni/Fe hydrogenase subunit alpha [Anaerolineales bacterium]|nr:Ni/Fe hydrogenase subunit alpha [Anaerolineales bacterium]